MDLIYTFEELNQTPLLLNILKVFRPCRAARNSHVNYTIIIYALPSITRLHRSWVR
jgi:hypothetical protein